jgi:hypothetical protein
VKAHSEGISDLDLVDVVLQGLRPRPPGSAQS